MKRKALFTPIITSFVFFVIALGVLVWLGCVASAIGQYWILGATLVVVLLYAYFTYEILQTQQEGLETQQARFQWDQNAILASTIKPQLVEKPGRYNIDIVDLITIFHIENLSRSHAVAKININPKVDGQPAATNAKYSGEIWWYVPALKIIDGNFSLLEILESVKTPIYTFRAKQIPLTLEIKVTYKRWGQRKDKPMLENPPDAWYYNHQKKRWIHEPTTSGIQFPIFSESKEES